LAGASKTGFDMDLGVFYELQDKMYVGVSAMHIPATTLKDANFDYNLERHYYIMGGYIQDIPQMNIQLKPSVFVKTDGASTQLDINGIALWENKVWGGVSYRMQDAVSPMVGFQKDVGDGIFKLGYSYDITTSQLRNSSTGSHEIMLGYCLRMKPEPPVEHVRTVRFL
ncbi:MAG: type IX secretion system membrane protein PorP/SprF, partial [Flavobacteriales bacterium]|nr:type IX secretion system membrane protein PorP/SprF [Flavobacteriales bacterium]